MKKISIKTNVKKHYATYLILIAALVVTALVAFAPADAASSNLCSPCHGTARSQVLDIVETSSTIPPTINVGETATVSVTLQNDVTAPTYTTLSGVTATLSSQNGRFTVSNPTLTVGNLQAGTTTLTWQITGVTAGPDALIISASAQNNHQNLAFYDAYAPNPTITVSQPAPPPPPPPTTYTLTLQSAINGATSPTAGTYSYTTGTPVTINAISNAGYQFDYWTINGNTQSVNPLTMTVTADTIVTPTFSLIPIPTYQLSIQSSANGATSPSAGTSSYSSGSSVTINAIPNAGYQFDSWTVNGNTQSANPLIRAA
jgi:hypothetical protein